MFLSWFYMKININPTLPFHNTHHFSPIRSSHGEQGLEGGKKLSPSTMPPLQMLSSLSCSQFHFSQWEASLPSNSLKTSNHFIPLMTWHLFIECWWGTDLQFIQNRGYCTTTNLSVEKKANSPFNISLSFPPELVFVVFLGKQSWVINQIAR